MGIGKFVSDLCNASFKIDCIPEAFADGRQTKNHNRSDFCTCYDSRSISERF